ncbi:MAG: DUF4166 domain-containing protein [Pseudomonadota bacterium]
MTAPPPLFQSALQERWGALPSSVRAFHAAALPASFRGTAEITRGRNPLTQVIAWVFRFPKAGQAVPVSVSVTAGKVGERWERRFAGARLVSHCSASPRPYRYRERFSIMTFEQDLRVENGRLLILVRRGWCLGVPLPGWLLPESDTQEYEAEGRFHFDVALSAPLGLGLIVHYRGALEPA